MGNWVLESELGMLELPLVVGMSANQCCPSQELCNPPGFPSGWWVTSIPREVQGLKGGGGFSVPEISLFPSPFSSTGPTHPVSGRTVVPTLGCTGMTFVP